METTPITETTVSADAPIVSAEETVAATSATAPNAETPIIVDDSAQGTAGATAPVVTSAEAEEIVYPLLVKEGFDPLNRLVQLVAIKEPEDGFLVTKDGFKDQFFAAEIVDVAHSVFDYELLSSARQ